MTDQLEALGFEVLITRHATGNGLARFYCRIRNHQWDQAFFGDTVEIALSKALTAVRPDA